MEPSVAVAASKVRAKELLTLGAGAGGVSWYVICVQSPEVEVTGICVLANVCASSSSRNQSKCHTAFIAASDVE